MRGHALVSEPQPDYPPAIKRRYAAHNIMTLSCCQGLMELKAAPQLPYEKLALQLYRERKKRGEADPVEIFEHTIDGEGRPSPLQGQFGLRATRTIEPNEIVEKYNGAIHLSTFRCEDPSNPMMPSDVYCHNFMVYAPFCIKALNEGSRGEIANNGPPNCGVIEYLDKGVPHLAIVAFKKIEAEKSSSFIMDRTILRWDQSL